VSAHPPKGESAREAYDRAVSAMHKIIDQHKGRNVCIVSGGILLSTLRCYLKNTDVDKMWKFVSDKTWWDTFIV